VKLAEVQDHMQKTVESTQRGFNTIRTGRANASLLDRIMVEYYGMETPLKSLATISTPDATTIAIQPFDRTSMGAIEKAISLSDVGLTPSNDGQTIRLNIPPLTSDRRKDKRKGYLDGLSFFLLRDRTGFLSVLFGFLSLFKSYRGVSPDATIYTKSVEYRLLMRTGKRGNT